MARRKGRPGDYLMTDDLYGVTRYASQMRRDFWGNYSAKPLKRNLQEIAAPLNDPIPVSIYRGPDYQITIACIGEIAPSYVGVTNVPTNPMGAAYQALNLNPALPDMEIGCTFTVR